MDTLVKGHIQFADPYLIDEALLGGDDGKTILKGQVSSNGSTVRLAALVEERLAPSCRGCMPTTDRRWRQVDTVLEAKVVDNRDGSSTVTGRSQLLSEEVGARGDEALVTFTVHPKGCPTCR